MNSWNNPTSDVFEPTIFVSWDLHKLPAWLQRVLTPYISWARSAARHQTDAVMVTHLLLYFSTSIPSAIYLYRNFTWAHGLLHWLMQSWYVGTYTLMRHQHIHGGGVLAKRLPYSLIDAIYPYLTDPLHGHTWNGYYYHHVKHHHVEGNGPDDLSSTIRYQRDSPFDFLCYLGRFLFFIWLDLPRYFLRKGRYTLAFKAFAWESSTLAMIVLLAYWRWKPTLFVLALPLLLTRVGLMIGNWGQHALVDEVEPDSDFRSSITLIDVAVSSHTFLPRRLAMGTSRLMRKNSPTATASTTATTPATTSTHCGTGASTPRTS
jgi:phosphoinositide-3-kinase regulatory subunit 4